MRSPRLTLALSALVLASIGAPASALGQQVQFTPFVGYRVFGSVTDFSGAEVDVDEALSYGGTLAYLLRPGMGIELGFSRQDTDARLTVPLLGRADIDVKVNQWTLGAHQQFGGLGGTVVPYLDGFFGLTHMSSRDGDGSATKFMIGPGAGVEFVPGGGRVGARLGGRGYLTFAGDGGSSIACGPNGCGYGFSGETFFQMDLVAGVSVSFGGADG